MEGQQPTAAYGVTKEKLYHDLDLDTYEFLPFIMETTGGLSEMAVGFCKEIKKRWESLNCWSDFECTRNYEINSLQSALNVELQRANSRMIFERTPELEDLIEGAIVKCKLAVAKKKEAAIEELKLGRLRPNRFHKNMKKAHCKDLEDPSIRESSIRGSPVMEVKKNNSRNLKKKKKKVNLSDEKWIRSKGGTIQSYVEESSNLLPLNPKPPEKCLSELRSVTMEWKMKSVFWHQKQTLARTRQLLKYQKHL